MGDRATSLFGAPEKKKPEGPPPRDLEGEAMLRDAKTRDTNQRHLGMLKDLGRGSVLGLNEILYGMFQNPYSPSGEHGLIDKQAARLQEADESGITGALGARSGSIPERTGEFAAAQLLLKGLGGLFAGGEAVAANPAITRIPVSIAAKAAEQGARSVPRMLTEEAAAASGAGAGSYYGEKSGIPGGELIGALAGGVSAGTGLVASRAGIRGGLRMIPGASDAVGALSEASPAASRFLPRISVNQQAADELGRAVGGDRAAILAQMENAQPMAGVNPTMAGLATVGSEAGPVAQAGVRTLERQVASENPSMATQAAVRVAEGRKTLDARLDAVRGSGKPEDLRRVFEEEVAADKARSEMTRDVQNAAETGFANETNAASQAAYERAIAKQKALTQREATAYQQGKTADAQMFAAERVAAEAEARRAESAAATSARSIPDEASVSSMTLQGNLVDIEKSVLQPLSARYESIYRTAEESGVKITTNDITRAFDEITPGGEQYSTLPGSVRNQLSELKQQTSWVKVQELDKALSRAIRAASDREQRFTLTKLQSATRGLLNAPEVASRVPGLAQLNAEYRNAMQVFRRGEMGDVLARNERVQTPGSAVVQKLIRRNGSEGSTEEASRLRDAIRGHSEAVQQADEAILSVGARDHFLVDGRVDVTAARKYLADYSEALAPFPNVRAKVQELIRIEQEAAAAKARVPVEPRKGPAFRATKQDKVPKPKEVKPDEVSSPEAERSLRTEYVIDPQATIAKLIFRGDREGMERLARYAGRSTRGRGDLKAAAMDFVIAKTGKRGSDGLSETLTKNGEALRGFLSADDIRDIREVSEQMAALERTEAAIPASSLHPANPTMSDSLTVGVSPITGSPVARIRESSPIHRMFGGVRDARVRAKLEAAFLDPRGAGVRLLRQVRGPNEIPLNRYLVNPEAVIVTEAMRKKHWPKGHR